MDCYIEPFVGAGAVFLDYAPKKALINDSNRDLIETYRAIKEAPEALLEALFDHKANHCKTHFYEIRAMDRSAIFDDLPIFLRAARLIYLNKTCFNGLYRVNAKGHFNVPYGRYANPQLFEAENIRAISAFLNKSDVVLSCGDFLDPLEAATSNTFVYLDPPYYCAPGENFTAYQAGGFSEEDHQRLYSAFCDLSKRGTRCLLSNSDTDFIRDLYSDFIIETVQVARSINRDASGRGKVNELLISNEALAQSLVKS